MYKCASCSAIFNDPAKYQEDTGGYQTGVGYYPYYEYFNICPVCGSDEINEAEKCECCGVYAFKDSLYISDDLKYLCVDCKEEWEI